MDFDELSLHLLDARVVAQNSSLYSLRLVHQSPVKDFQGLVFGDAWHNPLDVPGLSPAILSITSVCACVPQPMSAHDSVIPESPRAVLEACQDGLGLRRKHPVSRKLGK